MSDQTKDPDVERVRKALNELGEYFDSVHVFATRHESGTDDGTIAVHLGMGNWFARYGQIREWVNKREEEARVDVRKDDDKE